jgi:NADPH-dependent 2,4-dienoyl-CoA reductase/sulfur reductase-like enzyme
LRCRPSPLYLSVETACDWYNPRFRALVHCAHRFLTTRGYINFGVGCISSQYLAPGAAKGTVIVVGAGMAGLAAARQLTALGHRVAVVEGRDRAGGRVWTRRMAGVDPNTGFSHQAEGEMVGLAPFSTTLFFSQHTN